METRPSLPALNDLNEAYSEALNCLRDLRQVHDVSLLWIIGRGSVLDSFREKRRCLEESFAALRDYYPAARIQLEMASRRLPLQGELVSGCEYAIAQEALGYSELFALDAVVVLTALVVGHIQRASPDGITKDNLELCVACVREARVTTPKLDELREELERQYSVATAVLRKLSEGGEMFPSAPVSLTNQEQRVKWLAEAMLFVAGRPDWSDAKIARQVGKHPSTLCRSREYRAAAAMARGDKTDLPKGYVKVDSETGLRDVESYSDSDDPAQMDWDDP